MIQPIKAKVIQAPRQIKARYGHCSIIKIRLLNTNEEVPIFSKENDSNVLKRYVDEEVQVYQDANQKWRLIDNDNVRNVNGGGLHHISTTLNSSNIHNQEYSNDINDNLGDLDLPKPLTPEQKKAIHNLCVERAKLLVHSIEVVRKELDHKGLEFHEGSLRSLGVSLFIHISKNLP